MIQQNSAELPRESFLREKSVFIGNERGEAIPYSVEEILAKKLNHWNNWHCAIGVENLHISADGTIWGGACREGGYLGNVFEQKYSLPKEWRRCTRQMCFCGADMQIRKAKQLKYKPLTYAHQIAPVFNDGNDPVFVAPVHQEASEKHPLSITWDLGRRCNYSCSYCFESLSNNYEAHKSWRSLIFALEGLEKNFLKGKKAKFVFTGGEPTIHPRYMDLVEYLTDQGHLIHTTTNGSRQPDFFSELIEKSLIGFSYHFEFAKLDHYLEIINAIIAKKKINLQAKNNWCGIRLMVPPGRFNEAETVYHTLKKTDGLADFEINISMSPLYSSENATILLEYPGEELNKISELA